MTAKPTVVDFFCGAGGFSEGFRQQGFQVVMGVDNWRPAVETHNINHQLKDIPIDILKYENDDSIIDSLPNTAVIIGSPPCVDFSMSNRAGKAHKGLGIRLIETLFRIVAVKKHQKGTVLKVWLMENVPNSQNFVKDEYTFEDLDLVAWSRKRWPKAKSPEKRIALKARSNGHVLNAADYGSPQGRKRFVCGEIVKSGEFPMPIASHSGDGSQDLKRHVWLTDIKSNMPSPAIFDKDDVYKDPNYPSLKLAAAELTDHFYDTGLYSVEWQKARSSKINHPYMGRMSFPEDESRTCRTVMATRSASTREALIFKSEYERVGDGEFRLPTIREIATLMGFPYSYQFVGSEGTKWRLIGNAVCPHMSAALARSIRQKVFGTRILGRAEIDFASLESNYQRVNNLNAPGKKDFSKPPKRNSGAKFRQHPFKAGNMTVALMNYLPDRKEAPGKRWYAVLYFGSGKTYSAFPIKKEELVFLDEYIRERIPNGRQFQKDVINELIHRVGSADTLQWMYETNQESSADSLKPSDIVVEINSFVKKHQTVFDVIENFKLNGFSKQKMPVSQLFAAWALSLTSAKINGEEKTIREIL